MSVDMDLGTTHLMVLFVMWQFGGGWLDPGGVHLDSLRYLHHASEVSSY